MAQIPYVFCCVRRDGTWLNISYPVNICIVSTLCFFIYAGTHKYIMSPYLVYGTLLDARNATVKKKKKVKSLLSLLLKDNIRKSPLFPFILS